MLDTLRFTENHVSFKSQINEKTPAVPQMFLSWRSVVWALLLSLLTIPANAEPKNPVMEFLHSFRDSIQLAQRKPGGSATLRMRDLQKSIENQRNRAARTPGTSEWQDAQREIHLEILRKRNNKLAAAIERLDSLDSADPSRSDLEEIAEQGIGAAHLYLAKLYKIGWFKRLQGTERVHLEAPLDPSFSHTEAALKLLGWKGESLIKVVKETVDRETRRRIKECVIGILVAIALGNDEITQECVPARAKQEDALKKLEKEYLRQRLGKMRLTMALVKDAMTSLDHCLCFGVVDICRYEKRQQDPQRGRTKLSCSSYE